LLEESAGLYLAPHTFFPESVIVYYRGVALAAENEDGYTIPDNRHILLKQPISGTGEWIAATYDAKKVAMDIWHVPGGSWYVGSYILDKKYYRTAYDGNDIEGAIAAAWETSTLGVAPVPSFVKDGTMITTSDAGSSIANGLYLEGRTINGSVSYNSSPSVPAA